ncbi:MAG: hypothetical protein SWY16_11065 [Cyanobacteriota bacterium]|nr:hypothetical protein [Cyanobacteriota bacterium]
MSSQEKTNSSLVKNPLERSHEIRIKTTSKIWSFATGMLAICIPLSTATETGALLPISVILGATVGTAVVWNAKVDLSTDRQASEKIEALEGRISDLETIITAEDINWKYTLDSSSPQAILSRTAARIEASKNARSISDETDRPS